MKIEEIQNTQDDNLPIFYSKNAIVIFSAIASPIGGAILLNRNIRENGNKNYKPFLFSLAYSFIAIIAVLVIYFLYDYLSLTVLFLAVLFINAVGGYLLVNLFWDKHIGHGIRYHKRSIILLFFITVLLIPLAAFLLLVVGGFLVFTLGGFPLQN